MNRIVILLIACFILNTMNAQDLEKYRWEYRILLIKALDEDLAKYQEQLEELKQAPEGLKERKLIVYEIIENEFVSTDYTKGGSLNTGTISKEFMDDSFNPKEQFEVILIGLDGGVKRRKTDVFTKEALYAIIDGMPMRRTELRQTEGGK